MQISNEILYQIIHVIQVIQTHCLHKCFHFGFALGCLDNGSSVINPTDF